MGKFKQWLDNAALRTGNTIATPIRRTGEVGNLLGNVLRQWKSSVKNTAEVGKQTIDAIMDNFLNFSKVDGKRYQRFLKGSINAVSAVTRRPVMIWVASTLSELNQWVWKPITKLGLGKFFKGIWNATRIFSKKKGFDFAKYDTHETKWDTWINQIREKRIGFFGKWWSSEKAAEVKKANDWKEEVLQGGKELKKAEEPKKPIEIKKEEPKKIEKSSEDPHKESDAIQKKILEKDDTFLDKELAERWYGPGGKLWKESTPDPKKPDPKEKPVVVNKPADWDKPKSIDEIEKKRKEEWEKKDEAEQKKNYPERKSLDPKFKIQYKKDYEKQLGDAPNKAKVIERWKKWKKWENIDEILTTVKKENPTMAGYIEEEILNKAA